MSKEYIRTVTTRGSIPIAELVLFHTAFEHLIRFTKGIGVGDYIFELDPTTSFSGAQSLHMKTRTTDATENDELNIYLPTYLPPTKQVALLARLSSPNIHYLKSLYFTHEWYDGTLVHRARIIYDHATPKLTYLNSGGTETDINDLDHVLHSTSWHSINFPINLSKDLYRSFEIDEFHIDLSNIPIYTTDSGLLHHHRSTIGIITAGADPAEIYVDEFLVIQI